MKTEIVTVYGLLNLYVNDEPIKTVQFNKCVTGNTWRFVTFYISLKEGVNSIKLLNEYGLFGVMSLDTMEGTYSPYSEADANEEFRQQPVTEIIGNSVITDVADAKVTCGIHTNVPGYYGKGFAGFYGYGSAEFTFNAPQDGYYELNLRYSSESEGRKINLYVNGRKMTDITLAATKHSSDFQLNENTVWLNQGENSIKYNYVDQHVCIDALAVSNMPVSTEPIEIEGLEINPESIQLKSFETASVSVQAVPYNAVWDSNIVWESSDEEIAAVVDGVITAGIKSGKAVITATSHGKTAKCEVTVSGSSVDIERGGRTYYNFDMTKSSTFNKTESSGQISGEAWGKYETDSSGLTITRGINSYTTLNSVTVQNYNFVLGGIVRYDVEAISGSWNIKIQKDDGTFVTVFPNDKSESEKGIFNLNNLGFEGIGALTVQLAVVGGPDDNPASARFSLLNFGTRPEYQDVYKAPLNDISKWYTMNGTEKIPVSELIYENQAVVETSDGVLTVNADLKPGSGYVGPDNSGNPYGKILNLPDNRGLLISTDVNINCNENLKLRFDITANRLLVFTLTDKNNPDISYAFGWSPSAIADGIVDLEKVEQGWIVEHRGEMTGEFYLSRYLKEKYDTEIFGDREFVLSLFTDTYDGDNVIRKLEIVPENNTGTADLLPGVAEAVKKYREAYSSTPPTYAVYDNITNSPEAENPDTSSISFMRNIKLEDHRFKKGDPEYAEKYEGIKYEGPSQNGYHAVAQNSDYDLYYNPEGKAFYEQPGVFAYYDVNGLMMFDQGESYPRRITSYLDYDVVPRNYSASILPEFSYWFDTDKYIPVPTIDEKRENDKLTVTFSATNNAVDPTFNTDRKVRLPYGIMLWGNYTDVIIPDSAPEGTKVLSTDGLFIPVVLEQGLNEFSFEFEISGEKQQPESTGPVSIELSDDTADVAVNGNVTIRATVLTYAARNSRVTWESSDETVAAVSSFDDMGNYAAVTGVSPGKAVITAKTANGTVVKSCEVTVNDMISVDFNSTGDFSGTGTVENIFRGALIRNTGTSPTYVKTSVTVDTTSETYLHYDFSNRRGHSVRLIIGGKTFTVSPYIMTGTYTDNTAFVTEGVYRGKLNLSELLDAQEIEKSPATVIEVEFHTPAKGSTTVRAFAFDGENFNAVQVTSIASDLLVGGGTLDKTFDPEITDYSITAFPKTDRVALDMIPASQDIFIINKTSGYFLNNEKSNNFTVEVGQTIEFSMSLLSSDSTTTYNFTITKPEGIPEPDPEIIRDLQANDVSKYHTISNTVGGNITVTGGDDIKGTWSIDESGLTFNPTKATWTGFVMPVNNIDLTDPRTAIEIDTEMINSNGGYIATVIANKPSGEEHTGPSVNRSGKIYINIRDTDARFAFQINDFKFVPKPISTGGFAEVDVANAASGAGKGRYYGKINLTELMAENGKTLTSNSTLNIFIWGDNGSETNPYLYANFLGFDSYENGENIGFNIYTPLSRPEITSVKQENAYMVAGGQMPELPATVKAYYGSSGLSIELPVSWNTSGVITSQPGEYTVNGTIDSETLRKEGLSVTEGAVAMTVTVQDSAHILPGDCNEDGSINIQDLARMKKIIAAGSYSYNADFDGNMRIDAYDLASLKRLLLGEVES